MKMKYIQKIKGLMPATRRSIINIDGKLNEMTSMLDKVTNNLAQVEKKLDEIKKNEEKQDEQLRNSVELNRKEINKSSEIMNKSLEMVKKVREEVHDNNIKLKTSKQQIEQVQEYVSIVKNQVAYTSKGVYDYQREERIIVSLTSYQKRIVTTLKALERIFAQSLRPDKIILWLSEDNFPQKEQELPVGLVAMKQRGLEIMWCKGDIKSYKKIVPALKKYPKDIIITLDDDLLYDLELIEKLYNSYLKYPKAISAMRTHKIQYNAQGEVDIYANWLKECSEHIAEPRKDLLATTGAGTLFPPSIFPQEVLDENIFMRIAPTADDMWVKSMALKYDVPVVLVQENKPLRYIEGTQQDALWTTNIVENDMQLQNLMREYDISVDDII